MSRRVPLEHRRSEPRYRPRRGAAAKDVGRLGLPVEPAEFRTAREPLRRRERLGVDRFQQTVRRRVGLGHRPAGDSEASEMAYNDRYPGSCASRGTITTGAHHIPPARFRTNTNWSTHCEGGTLPRWMRRTPPFQREESHVRQPWEQVNVRFSPVTGASLFPRLPRKRGPLPQFDTRHRSCCSKRACGAPRRQLSVRLSS